MRQTASLQAQERMFVLASGTADLYFETADYSTGLLAPMSTGAVMCCGVYRGWATVTAESTPQEPDLDDLTQWDDVADVSVHAPQGLLKVHQLAYGVTDSPPNLPDLSPHGPGHYRVRVYARGRDAHQDEFEDESAEEYLIQAWPQEPAPPLIIRATDKRGYGVRLGSLTQVRAREHVEHPLERTQRERGEATKAALLNLRTRLHPDTP